MGIIRTTMLAFALASGASGNGLEKTVKQEVTLVKSSEEQPRYVTVNGTTYRQRPPRASCDPTLYGPVNKEPTPHVPGTIYFGLALAAVIGMANLMRKRQDEMITKYAPQRAWDFFGTQPPISDYEMEREERDF